MRKVRGINYGIKNITGTKNRTELKERISGESWARNKYIHIMHLQPKLIYEQMSALYLETMTRKEHAKMWFKELHG